jgi:aminoglycoside phosphotransferase (APT) family kinase protein
MEKDLAQALIARGRTAEVYAWDAGTVLKLFLEWCPPAWVEFEANTVRAVHAAGIRTPAALEVVEVNGRRGVVYEKVEGISMLREMARNPLKLVDFARQMARLQLEIHQIAGAGLPDLGGRLKGSIEAAQALPEALRQAALRRLAALPVGDRVCHADFHPDNILVSQGQLVVIDWVTAACGHPAADVARTQILLSIGEPPPGTQAGLALLLKFGRGLFYRSYLATIRRAVPERLAQAAEFLPVVAAARFAENISGEPALLLPLVQRLTQPQV